VLYILHKFRKVLIKSGESIIMQFIRTSDLYINNGKKRHIIFYCNNFKFLNKLSNQKVFKD